jgi:transposase
LIESIQRFRATVQLPGDGYIIADSALYTSENINKLGQGSIHWITHVPSNITEIKTLLHGDFPMDPVWIRDIRSTPRHLNMEKSSRNGFC